MRQLTLASQGSFEKYGKQTRREKFLAELESLYDSPALRRFAGVDFLFVKTMDFSRLSWLIPEPSHFFVFKDFCLSRVIRLFAKNPIVSRCPVLLYLRGIVLMMGCAITCSMTLRESLHKFQLRSLLG